MNGRSPLEGGNLNGKALICDSSSKVRDSLRDILKEFNFEIFEGTSGEESLGLLKNTFFNLVILDTDMKDIDRVNILSKLRTSINPNVSIILTTQTPKVETAVAGIKLGVIDYLIKPLNPEEVIKSVKKAINKGWIVGPEPCKDKTGLGLLVGLSPKMQSLYSRILAVAPTDSTVCIQGESGVGKELVAKTIHELSPRKDANFVSVNCSAVPETLLEAELFGYIKGAFSGAARDHLGSFRASEGGTIFLNEIAEIPPRIQVKLLRVLEEKEVKPIGSDKSYKVDVRIITATTRNLERALLEGRIRHDFFHRLVPMTIPSLRERKEDIPLLVEHFLSKLNNNGPVKKRVSDEALHALCAYDWPENVKELEDIIKNAYVTSVSYFIALKDLPLKIRESKLSRPGLKPITWSEAQRNLIHETLLRTHGNKSQAARFLGIDRKTLYRKLKEYQL